MTQRRTSRQDQLLETATRLFREKGYHHACIQDRRMPWAYEGQPVLLIEGKQDLLGMLNWTQERFSRRHRYTAREIEGTPADPALGPCRV